MHRGTTPTLTVAPDVPVSTLQTAELTLAQPEHSVQIVRQDLLWDAQANTLSVTFTQEETLRLHPGQVLVQLRALSANGQAIASAMATTTVQEILRDGVIGNEHSAEL